MARVLGVDAGQVAAAREVRLLPASWDGAAGGVHCAASSASLSKYARAVPLWGMPSFSQRHTVARFTPIFSASCD